MYIFIKNSYSSLQYLVRSILWMELLNLLILLKSVCGEFIPYFDITNRILMMMMMIMNIAECVSRV